jgi:hypothetical protein
MTLESKLRALVAGMRYAADRAEEEMNTYSSRDTRGRASAGARARTMRSDAAALEAVLNEHNEARDAR